MRFKLFHVSPRDPGTQPQTPPRATWYWTHAKTFSTPLVCSLRGASQVVCLALRNLTFISCMSKAQQHIWIKFITMVTSLHISRAGGWFNIKITSYQHRKSHCGDKTILRPSYLHNGGSYTGKTTTLYWIRAQVTNIVYLRVWHG